MSENELSESTNKRKKLLSPKQDIVFQVLFGEKGSENITKEFLEAILHEKITKVNLDKNPILRSMKPKNKKGILDVLVEIDGNKKCNIEMQVGNREDIIPRILYYWSRTYIRDLKSGEEYDKLQRTIVVLIADFELQELKELDFFTDWALIEKKGRKAILTDFIDVIIIEIPKIYRLKGTENEDKLLEWIYFLDNPNSEVVNRIMENNNGVKEAKEKLQDMSNDIIMQRLAEWEESAKHDEASVKAMARRKGLQEGREEGLKKGMAKGLEKGLKKGLEKGLEKGHKDEKLEIAKKMKQKGMELATIIELTALTKEEIENLE